MYRNPIGRINLSCHIRQSTSSFLLSRGRVFIYIFNRSAGEVGPNYEYILVSSPLLSGSTGHVPNVGLVIIRFLWVPSQRLPRRQKSKDDRRDIYRAHHPFLAVFFPVFTILNISSSDIPFTFGKGTLNLAADSFRLFLIALDKAFALEG